jgi:hypothetical protein
MIVATELRYLATTYSSSQSKRLDPFIGGFVGFLQPFGRSLAVDRRGCCELAPQARSEERGSVARGLAKT